MVFSGMIESIAVGEVQDVDGRRNPDDRLHEGDILNVRRPCGGHGATNLILHNYGIKRILR